MGAGCGHGVGGSDVTISDSMFLAGSVADYKEVVGLAEILSNHPYADELEVAKELLTKHGIILDPRIVQRWFGCEVVNVNHEHTDSCNGRWVWITEVKVRT